MMEKEASEWLNVIFSADDWYDALDALNEALDDARNSGWMDAQESAEQAN